MERLEMRREVTYSTAARARLCAASCSSAFRAVSSVHLVCLLSLNSERCWSVCVLCLVGELAMLWDGDVEGGGDKEGGDAGPYILDTIRLGRQEMLHVDSCIGIRALDHCVRGR